MLFFFFLLYQQVLHKFSKIFTRATNLFRIVMEAIARPEVAIAPSEVSLDFFLPPWLLLRRISCFLHRLSVFEEQIYTLIIDTPVFGEVPLHFCGDIGHFSENQKENYSGKIFRRRSEIGKMRGWSHFPV